MASMTVQQHLRLLQAHHEAGHAVVAHLLLALSRKAGYAVNLERDGAFGGATPVNHWASDSDFFRVLWAGYHAELDYCQMIGTCAPTHAIHAEHAQDDFAMLQRRALKAGGLAAKFDVGAFTKADHEWTVGQIRQPENWYAIRKLARQLRQRGSIEGSEVAALIERAHQDFPRVQAAGLPTVRGAQ